MLRVGYVGLKTVFILQIIWLIRKPISGDQFTISVISFPFFLAQRAFPFYPQEVKAFIFHFIVNTIFCFPAFSRLKNILSITSLPVHPGWVGKMKEIILFLSLSLEKHPPLHVTSYILDEMILPASSSVREITPSFDLCVFVFTSYV